MAGFVYACHPEADFARVKIGFTTSDDPVITRRPFKRADIKRLQVTDEDVPLGKRVVAVEDIPLHKRMKHAKR